MISWANCRQTTRRVPEALPWAEPGLWAESAVAGRPPLSQVFHGNKKWCPMCHFVESDDVAVALPGLFSPKLLILLSLGMAVLGSDQLELEETRETTLARGGRTLHRHRVLRRVTKTCIFKKASRSLGQL